MDTPICCDICGETFKVEEYQQKKAFVFGFGVSYFQCPNCKHNYPFLIEDKEQQKLHLQIQSIWTEAKVREAKGKSLPKSKIRLLNRLTTQAKEHQSTLRDIHFKAVTDQLNMSEFTETNSLTGEEEV